MATLRTFYLQLVSKGPRGFLSWAAYLGLLPLSCVYGVGLFFHRLVYSLGFKTIYHASVPIVSVGNLSVGGTGKTPMADFLAKWMVRRKIPVAIVSRGYGGHYNVPVLRVDLNKDGGTQPEECGDEPFLLASKNPSVPVFVARRRAAGVEAAEKAGAQLIILDDGFQHRAVHRDLDIVLLDSKSPFGNGCLLPAGPLREPKAALQRGHLVVMTRKSSSGLDQSVTSIPTISSRHVMTSSLTSLSGRVVDWGELTGKSCLAFAGIAKPDEFFSGLKAQHLTLVDEIALADHQEYDEPLLERLRLASRGCDALITTEKDAVKLSALDFPIPCYTVGVELTFEDQAQLDILLLNLLAKDPVLKQKSP